jgi:DNA polymerase bacteriophage-type
MRVLYFDTETFSAIDLTKVWAYIYARHETTDVRLVTYCLVIDGARGDVKAWQQGDPVPPEFTETANDPSALVKTYNDAFDRQIQEQILTPRYGFPAFPIAQRRCVQAAALSRALPASLDGAAGALGIGIRKDPKGIAMMKRLSKPRRQTAQERKAGKPLDFSATPEEMATLVKYAKDDVAMTMEIDDCIGPLPPSEQALWELDQLINERGVHADMRLIENAIEVGGEAKLALYEEIAELTGGR